MTTALHAHPRRMDDLDPHLTDLYDLDPRLAGLYDLDNPDGPDHDLYRALADEADARAVTDLGCGTGILTVTFARPDRRVVGIDPSATMLDVARTRPGTEHVSWTHGDSSHIEVDSADLVVMTGNVAQHITGEAWPRALADVAAGLHDGGLLAFESRNPSARAWERWAAEQPTTRDTTFGPLTEWTEVEAVTADVDVDLAFHNVIEASGEHLVARQRLSFRSASQLRDDLADAGLGVEHLWGGWHREPLDDDSPIIIVVARRA